MLVGVEGAVVAASIVCGCGGVADWDGSRVAGIGITVGKGLFFGGAYAS